MAVDHVKSTGITNMDTLNPRVRNTAGKDGSAGQVAMVVSGHATAVASSSADATYQLLRVPASAKIKSLAFASEAQAAGKFDIGVYYATDGTCKAGASSLLAAAALDQDLFATVIDCAAKVDWTEIMFEAGTFTFDEMDKPLWEVVGLTADPGGNFDIVATVKTTAVTTGTGKIGLRAIYVP